jgi:PucR C-terminal helix-turn-helix domain
LVGQILDRDVARQVTALGKVLLKDADELAVEMADSIRAAVPIYRRADIVTTEQLRQASRANVEVIFTELRGEPATSSARSYDNGRARARAGVPLTAVMAAYRVAAAFLWEKLAHVAGDSCAGAEVIVAAATQMWLVLDTFTTEMADGYREEITAHAIFGEQQRSSLVQAILHGQLTDTSLWEAAETLRLPPQGTYTVITAALAEPGRPTPHDITGRLAVRGIPSAWGLTHDTEVGIALTRDPVSDVQTLIVVLRETNRRPAYHSLTDSPEALRLARIALRACTPQNPVTVFDRDRMAIAAVAAPDVMRRLADLTLVGLADLPTAERHRLLQTFGAWLDHDGSATRAAEHLFCHPNTVRYRLRRLAEYTGHTLDDPHWIAELALAYQIDLHSDTSQVDRPTPLKR